MKTYKQRPYFPKNVEKYKGDPTKIFMRSSWETRFATWADRNPAIIAWGSENIIIPYESPVDGRFHRYFVDFWIEIKTEENKIKKYLIEIKPACQCVPPNYSNRKRKPRADRILEEQRTYCINQAKWESARKFAKKHGCEFIVLTEHELGLEKN